jgi:phosphatidylglycerophosphatase A
LLQLKSPTFKNLVNFVLRMWIFWLSLVILQYIVLATLDTFSYHCKAACSRKFLFVSSDPNRIYISELLNSCTWKINKVLTWSRIDWITFNLRKYWLCLASSFVMKQKTGDFLCLHDEVKKSPIDSYSKSYSGSLSIFISGTIETHHTEF